MKATGHKHVEELVQVTRPAKVVLELTPEEASAIALVFGTLSRREFEKKIESYTSYFRAVYSIDTRLSCNANELNEQDFLHELFTAINQAVKNSL